MKTTHLLNRLLTVSSRIIICVSLPVLCPPHETLHAQVTFDWATVGNPGNEPDQEYFGQGQLGAVANTYRISKYEVTNDQYAEFLNAVAATDSFPGADPNLYNSTMDITQSGSAGSFTYAVNAGFGPNPVRYVSFFDTMRFVNWLENGQTSAGTESGVYTIADGVSEARAGGATFFIPSQDEWYKAAYHDPRLEAAGGPPGDDNYWLLPTQSDTDTFCVDPPGAGNSANCEFEAGFGTTDVGAYTNTTNFYGTFDQGGNVSEWTETAIGSTNRIQRGGSWAGGRGVLRASRRNGGNPTTERDNHGFRVASSLEPTLGCDFSGDGACDVTDLDLMQALGVLDNQSLIPFNAADDFPAASCECSVSSAVI